MASAPQRPQSPPPQLLEVLLSYGRAFGDLGRQFGAHAALHVTDGQALVEIVTAQDRGRPLTQSQLSQRIGLSSGATSSLLNRLEEAGHVRRLRDSADRRLVTLQATANVNTLIDHFFTPLGERISALAQTYPPEVLAQFAHFLEELTTLTRAYIHDTASRPQT